MKIIVKHNKLPRKLKKARNMYFYWYFAYPRTKWVNKYLHWRKREQYRVSAWLRSRSGGVVSGVIEHVATCGEYVMGKDEQERLKEILSAKPKDGFYANVRRRK